MIDHFLLAVRLQLLLTFRDRRTVLLLIAIPILLSSGSLSQLRKQLSDDAAPVPRVAYGGEASATVKSNILDGMMQLGLVARESEAPHKDVSEGEADVGLLFAADAAGRPTTYLVLQAGHPGSMVVAVSIANLISEIAAGEAGLTPAMRSALSFVGQKGAVQEALLLMLLSLVTIIPGLGAMQVAGDLGAGEKERRTLEVVLAAPVPTTLIAGAKYVAIFLMNAITCTLALVSQFAGLMWLQQHTGLPLPPLPPLAVPVFLMVVAVCTLVSGVSLVISLLARTIREAMIMMVPVQLVFVAAVLWVSQTSSANVGAVFALLPMVNIVLLVKQLVIHNTATYLMVLVASGTTMATGILLCLWGGWLLRRESVVSS